MTQSVAWGEDYEKALGERLALVYFWMEGRPLCREMEAEVFTRPGVARLLSERFAPVKVNVEKRPELFARLLGGRGALACAVVDGRGDVVSALPGYAESGAVTRFLERALEGYPALRAAREASEKAPGDAERLFALGEAYAGLESPKRAEECFRKVVESGMPKWTAFAHERLARFRAMRGRCQEAREHLAAYRKLDPEGAFGREDRAIVTEAVTCAFERKHDEALRLLAEALKKHPGSGEVDYMLLMAGVVHHESGSDAKALGSLEEMVRRFPGSPWVTYARVKMDHIRNPPPDHPH